MSDGTDKLCEWSDNVWHIGFRYRLAVGGRRESHEKGKGWGTTPCLDWVPLTRPGAVLRSGGLKVRLAQVDCVGEFKGKGGWQSLW